MATHSRIFIYAADYSVLFGCHIETARKKMRGIKRALQLDRPPTVSEFANFFKIKEEEVKAAIK